MAQNKELTDHRDVSQRLAVDDARAYFAGSIFFSQRKCLSQTTVAKGRRYVAMDPFAHRLETADRLNLILSRVGFALWQIQELESVAANYFVLLVQAQKGMGLEAGNLLFEKAQKKTFGATVRRLAEAELLTPELERGLNDLLAERNWLVHRSRSASRSAPYNDAAAMKLLDRLEKIAQQALTLLKEIGELVETFAKKHGTTDDYIYETSKRLLEQWRLGDAS